MEAENKEKKTLEIGTILGIIAFILVIICIVGVVVNSAVIGSVNERLESNLELWDVQIELNELQNELNRKFLEMFELIEDILSYL